MQMLELLIEEIRPVDMSPETAAAWVLSATPRAPDAVLDLFCFPSAGMSAKLQYRTWQETLPDFIQVKVRTRA